MNCKETAIEQADKFRLHPLGFFYLAQNQGDDLNRRVHVWFPKTERTVRHVGNVCHQHSFDIHSTIHMGCMRNEIFRFTERREGSQREFEISYSDELSSLSPTGRRGVLEMIASFESNAGKSYFLKAGVIHRVSVTDRPCISFLTPEERDIPIFSYGDDLEEPPFERRLVNYEERDEIIRLLHLVE